MTACSGQGRIRIEVKSFARNLIWVGLLLAGMRAGLLAQGAGSAVVTFTMDFPNSDPSHYSISVDAAGQAHYESAVKVEGQSEEDIYRTEFEMSAANRERIFELARQAKYFEGKIDSGNKKLAFTGAKILSYQEGQRSFTARYNYSTLEPVRGLTSLFENMESTLEFGRKLAYSHKYQKLALDEELKEMEAQARGNQLTEIQGVAPVLQEIADDSSVMNVVRARAKELIGMGSVEQAGK